MERATGWDLMTTCCRPTRRPVFRRGSAATRLSPPRRPSLVPVHTPVHASRLNQIEIYFSVVQCKVLTPNDFATLAELEARLLAFQQRYEAMATPFR